MHEVCADMSELQGRRLPDAVWGEGGWTPTDMEVGDYRLIDMRGRRELYFRDPVGNIGRCVTHTITEEPDGTVTVEPSIADEGVGSWHGWLRKGVWTW